MDLNSSKATTPIYNSLQYPSLFDLNDEFNETLFSMNVTNITKTTATTSYVSMDNSTEDKIIGNVFVQTSFSIFYTAIFIIGITGNVLVCYVVCRNKAMHTVTNFFITNLALSDILLCILAVPFTPLYTFLGKWIFGNVLCHLVPFAQGVSMYISTLTLTSIAMDRFIVIIYPFRHRMKISTCILLIMAIWIISLLLTLPYGLYVSLNTDMVNDISYCEEDWPSENTRKVYGTITVCLQFAIPFVIITVCYILVSYKLNVRAKTKLGSKTAKKEEADRERKRRTNHMLISMVGVFAISWMPLNAVNIFNDYYETKNDFYTLLFFFAHCIAMSSTCYNPFLYAWLNENFRKEFKQVLPFFRRSGYNGVSIYSRAYRSDRQFSQNDCGGPDASTRASEIIPRGPTCNCSIKKPMKLLEETETFSLKDDKKAMVKPDARQINEVQEVNANIYDNTTTESNTTTLPTGLLETQFDVLTSITTK